MKINSETIRTDVENFKVGKNNVLCVNVISSYLTQEQEWFDCLIDVTPINQTIENQLEVEKEILKQIIPFLKNDTDELLKLSLCYKTPFKSKEELIKSGYGFMLRTNSKYFFTPEYREEFIDSIVEELDICKDLY